MELARKPSGIVIARFALLLRKTLRLTLQASVPAQLAASQRHATGAEGYVPVPALPLQHVHSLTQQH